MAGQAMEREIRRQPEVLASNCDSYFGQASSYLAGREFEMIVLVARGSSDHAALYARYLFEIHLQIPVILAAPSVLTRYGAKVRYRNALAIGISQSGAAPDVAEVLAGMKTEGHATISITNTEGSRLAKEAEATIFLNCGEETSVAATMTYTSSLLALYQIARVLEADLPDPRTMLPDDDWIEQTAQAAIPGAGGILRSHTNFALARGYSFCSAFETALKLMECALIACKSYSTADFQHGPKALAGHGSAAIVYGPPLDFLSEQGCLPFQAPSPPNEIPETLRPIWEIAFGQWLALLAARARGLDPDDPRFIEKITKTL